MSASEIKTFNFIVVELEVLQFYHGYSNELTLHVPSERFNPSDTKQKGEAASASVYTTINQFLAAYQSVACSR